MNVLFVIFIAGGIGSVCRYSLGAFIQRHAHVGFPVGTLAVNLVGCIAVGLLGKFFLHSQTEQVMRAALIVGFCGGFTTFSTFSYETLALINAGDWPRAAAYVAASVAACVLGTMVGFAVGPSLTR